MAIRHIREAYNQEAGNHSICRSARLEYVPGGGPGQPQKQIITFDVVRFDGTAETVQTPVHEISDNPHEQARQLARTLRAHDKFADETPGPYTPPPIDAPQEKWTEVKNAPPIPRPKQPPAPEPPMPPMAPAPPPPVSVAKIPPNPWIE